MKASLHSSNKRGFSLVELLAVFAITAVVVAGIAGAADHLRNAREGRLAAERFLTMVRESARLAAAEDSVVRLAFLTAEKTDELRENSSSPLPEGGGIRIYVHRIPGRHLASMVTVSPMAGAGPLPLARVPRFESMTGRWMPAPDPHLGWSALGRRVNFSTELLDQFDSLPLEAFAGRWLHVPEETWAADIYEDRSPFATTHPDFALTPIDVRETPATGTPPDRASLRLFDQSFGADILFGESGAPHWSGSSERLPLPALDFLPAGGLAHTAEREVRFHFSDDRNPEARWTVVIDARTSKAWIE
jgi:prepilin-type N-terminal cleavage/methylation domain-containing protein